MKEIFIDIPEVEHGYWKKLAKSLNVTSYCISQIINNRNWKHIEV